MSLNFHPYFFGKIQSLSVGKLNVPPFFLERNRPREALRIAFCLLYLVQTEKRKEMLTISPG